MIPGPSLGQKKDWGVSLNGNLPQFDYEVALTQGSGAEFNSVNLETRGMTRSAGQNWVVAGRIGTPYDRNVSVGLSGFYGEVLRRRMPAVIRRARIGADVTWIIDQFTVLGEISFGENFDHQVLNAIGELGWASSDEILKLYMQLIYLGRESATIHWDADAIARTGVVWQIKPKCELSAQYDYDIYRFPNTTTDFKFTLQLRLYF